MILHLAAFRWKDDVTPDDVAAVTDALRAMAAGIPELRSYVCGEAMRLRPGSDYGVAAIVDDEAGLTAYLDSDAHKEVYEKFLGRMIAERAALQLPVGDGASL
ncbi:MAG TPA: Dabb family protein [Pseudolysinimonas sp.]|nr:Dabb family protein [Pseudolysinimonas sp.]